MTFSLPSPSCLLKLPINRLLNILCTVLNVFDWFHKLLLCGLKACVKMRQRKTKLSHGNCSHYRECEHAAKAQLVLAAEILVYGFPFPMKANSCSPREVTRWILHRVTFFAIRTPSDDQVHGERSIALVENGFIWVPATFDEWQDR